MHFTWDCEVKSGLKYMDSYDVFESLVSIQET